MFSLRAQGYPFLCLLQFIILSIVEDLGSAVGQGNMRCKRDKELKEWVKSLIFVDDVIM